MYPSQTTVTIKNEGSTATPSNQNILINPPPAYSTATNGIYPNLNTSNVGPTGIPNAGYTYSQPSAPPVQTINLQQDQQNQNTRQQTSQFTNRANVNNPPVQSSQRNSSNRVSCCGCKMSRIAKRWCTCLWIFIILGIIGTAVGAYFAVKYAQDKAKERIDCTGMSEAECNYLLAQHVGVTAQNYFQALGNQISGMFQSADPNKGGP